LAKSAGVHAAILAPAEAAEQLRTGKVALVVVPGTPRIYRFDPTRPESRLARAVIDDILQRSDGRGDPTPVRDAPVTAPGSRYIDFLLPGLIGSNLMSGGMWGIGYVIVQMRTRKLIKRLIATPMRRTHFLASFLVVRAGTMPLELVILIAFGKLAFDVGVRGSLALVVAVAMLGSLAFAGLGLLVASRAKNTQTVSGLMNLVMMPMYVCSGVFFSAAHFPDVMQPLIQALPLTALNDALRAVMIDGAGTLGIARQLAVMTSWAVLTFAAALGLFRWR
jgi:ABC-type multidrug transport system permease subunit